MLLLGTGIFDSFPPHGGTLVITAWWGIWHIISGLSVSGLCTDLREELLSLIGKIPERRHDRLALRIIVSLLSLPLFVACIVPAAPIWLPEVLIVSRLKDKAWTHTVSFALRLLLPIFVPFYLLFNRLLNLYRDLLEDLRG